MKNFITMMIAKAGRPERAPSNMSSIPTTRRRGSENCGHLAEPGSENCSTATRFPTMQLVPPDDGCEDARRPTGRLRDDPLILVLMMGSLRTSQAAGGFTITPHTPGVQCCTKRSQAEKFDRILVIEAYKTKYCVIKLTQKNIILDIQYFIVPDFAE